MKDEQRAHLRFGCEIDAAGIDLARPKLRFRAKGAIPTAPYFDVAEPGSAGHDVFLRRERVGYEWNAFFLYVLQIVPVEVVRGLTHGLIRSDAGAAASRSVADGAVARASFARLDRMTSAYEQFAGTEVARRIAGRASEVVPSHAFLQLEGAPADSPHPPDEGDDDVHLLCFWSLLAREAFLASLNDRVARALGDDPDSVVRPETRENPMFAHLAEMDGPEFTDYLRNWHRKIGFPSRACKRLVADVARIGIKRIAMETDAGSGGA